jgi:hypothetical protein
MFRSQHAPTVPSEKPSVKGKKAAPLQEAAKQKKHYQTSKELPKLTPLPSRKENHQSSPLLTT